MKTHETSPILCGTDFSENAAQAATVAGVLAARMTRPLVLAHVADEFHAHAESKKVLDGFLKPVRQRLEVEAERLRKAGAEVDVELLHGSVAEKALTEVAGRLLPALVVVSAVSKTAFDRWTLGSVSEALAESVVAPTLVVRDAAPFQAWARGERALKILVGADFSANSDAALRWVAELRKFGPCEVIAAYAAWTPEEASRLDALGELSLVGNSPVVQSVLERDIQAKVTGLLGQENVGIKVQGGWGRPDAQLVGMA
ncbi:MAG: universal stress protein, partial [Opitutaceae bacterium]